MEKLKIPVIGSLEQSYDPSVLDKLRVQTLNKSLGDLTGHHCPQCLNKGFIAFNREDGQLATRPCDCMRIRKCVWEMEKSGLQNSIRDMTFDAFQVKEPWQQVIRDGAMAYAQEGKGWLLFCGQPGSGKTHLCTAVCRQRLYAGDQVRYLPWRDKITQIKACAGDGQRRDELISGFKEAGVLYIDDLFKSGDAPTAADIAIAFEIINYRYVNRMPTIISTERSPQELVSIDEATGSRILDCAGSHVYHIGKDQKRNYRLRHVQSL